MLGVVSVSAEQQNSLTGINAGRRVKSGHICAMLSHSLLPTYTGEGREKNVLMRWRTNNQQPLEVENDSPHKSTQAALCERGNRCLALRLTAMQVEL